MRHTYSGLLSVEAECQTCGWSSQARNAQGLAAQHCDRYEHSVRVTSVLSVSYLNDADHEKRKGRQR